MHQMLHEIHIQAAPRAVLEALTHAKDLRAWWTDDCSATPEPGSVAEFGFGGRATVFRMRIDELTDARVVWRCLGDHDEWRGTRLEWDVSAIDTAAGATTGAATTRLRMRHADWASDSGWFALCNTTWGALMHRLKDQVEGRRPGPMFTGAA